MSDPSEPRTEQCQICGGNRELLDWRCPGCGLTPRDGEE